MDSIAIISDIHGNLPALNAVMQDIKRQEIRKIYCLGDMAGKGPSTSAALEEIRKNCEVVLKGNWEYLISDNPEGEVIKWHHDKLTANQLKYIKNLPIYFEFYISGKLARLCHAAPFSVFHRVRPNACNEEKLELFGGVGDKECDILGYGDIHGSYIQNIRDKTIFNTGSVGNPLDITKASYAVLKGKFGSREEAEFSIELIKVPYDIEKAVAEAEESDMPEIEMYIKELRTGIFRRKNLV